MTLFFKKTEVKHMKVRSRQRGSVLLPFVLGFGAVTMMVGATVEGALLLHARNKLFNDAETALLASANLYFSRGYGYQTFQDVNLSMKNDYALDSFLDPSRTYLDFSRVACTCGILILHTSKTVPLRFLKKTTLLRADLAARIPGPPENVQGIVPLAMVVEDLENPFALGTEYVMKPGGGGGASGNYGALSLAAAGAKDYTDNIKYGYPKEVKVGDLIFADSGLLETKPGNMKGPTEEGFSYRLSQGEDVAVVVVTDRLPDGRGDIVARGFAAFRVKAVNSKGELTGEFIRHRISSTPLDDAQDYGLITKARLVYY
ncbi:hypothetical protein HY522_01560 [bacterium]|nr:hypothetical protein [bacterium]